MDPNQQPQPVPDPAPQQPQPTPPAAQPTATQPGGTPGITPSFELFNKSVEAIKFNLSTFLAFIGIIVALFFGSGLITGFIVGLSGTEMYGKTYVDPETFLQVVGITLAVTLIASIVVIILSPGITITILESARRNKISVGSAVQRGLPFVLRYVGLSILVGLAVAVGLLLFIVPGIIMLRRYFLAPYFLIDQNLGVLEAMQRSADSSKPYSGSVYGIIGVSILLGIASGTLGMIPIVGAIAGMILTSAYMCAPGLRYLELKKLAGFPESTPASTQPPVHPQQPTQPPVVSV